MNKNKTQTNQAPTPVRNPAQFPPSQELAPDSALQRRNHMAQQAIQKLDIKKLSDLLVERKLELQKAAGNALNPETLTRVALTAVQKNPLLMQCSQASILTAIMDSASYGLVPNSLTNEGHLVPFWSTKKQGYECTFIAGYKGLIKLATNTGLIDGVDVRPFFKNDFMVMKFFKLLLIFFPFIVRKPVCTQIFTNGFLPDAASCWAISAS